MLFLQIGNLSIIDDKSFIFMSHSNIFSRAISSILAMGVLLCTMVSAIGCTESLDEGTVKDNATVYLKLDEAFQEKAYIRLNHDGAQDDYWFYLVTGDFQSKADSLLQEEIDAVVKAEGYIYGNVGTNKNITIEGLKANTSYRVIASRIKTNGSITGNVAELVFKTLRDPNVFIEHPEWYVQYSGRQVEQGNPDAETELFSCYTGKSADTYVPCLLSKSDYDRAYAGNLRACFEDYVAFRNSENVKWPNVVVSGDYGHVEDRLRSGEYMIFMIGITPSGELTGYYAITECSIEQEKASAAYRNWIGQWTLNGECNGQKITYNVNIAADENNLYYRMSGWESTTALNYFAGRPTERPILLYFEKSTGFAYVVSEQLQDLDDPTLAEFYDFYLYGCVKVDYDGVPTDVPVDAPNLKIARFEMKSDVRAVAYPETFEFELSGSRYVEPFLYFNYSYVMPSLYQGLIPVTTDAVVPRIDTITLSR